MLRRQLFLQKQIFFILISDSKAYLNAESSGKMENHLESKLQMETQIFTHQSLAVNHRRLLFLPTVKHTEAEHILTYK